MLGRLSLRQSASCAYNVASRCRPRLAIAARLTLAAQFRSLSTELPKPQPDIGAALSNPGKAIRNIEARGSVTSLPAERLLDALAEARSQVKKASQQVRELREERNAVGKTLASKAASTKQKEAARERATALREKLKLESILQADEERLLELGLQLPNDTAPETPVGGYDACEVVRQSKDSSVNTDLPESPQSDHVSIMTALGWLHTPASITGSGWPYLIGGGAALENALTRFALEQAAAAGFELVIPPDVVKHDVMQRCGFAPRDSGGESQTYLVSTSSDAVSGRDTLALAATAEIPLAGLFANKMYKNPGTELPIKYAGLGHAFRAEAGSRGKESRGLYRVHQFTKVELFVTTVGDTNTSQTMLEDLVDLQWKILKTLTLPLRCVKLPSCTAGC